MYVVELKEKVEKLMSQVRELEDENIVLGQENEFYKSSLEKPLFSDANLLQHEGSTHGAMEEMVKKVKMMSDLNHYRKHFD